MPHSFEKGLPLYALRDAWRLKCAKMHCFCQLSKAASGRIEVEKHDSGPFRSRNMLSQAHWHHASKLFGRTQRNRSTGGLDRLGEVKIAPT